MSRKRVARFAIHQNAYTADSRNVDSQRLHQRVDGKLLVENAGLFVETILNDLQGIPRCLVGRKLPGVANG